jgi:hypothetical protein
MIAGLESDDSQKFPQSTTFLDTLSVPDLPIGCIGCSLGALEHQRPKNDEKGPKRFKSAPALCDPPELTRKIANLLN